MVVNDRWGSDNPPIESGHHFGGYFSGSDRQKANPTLLAHKWESAFTLDAHNWGYARNDGISAYLDFSTIMRNVVSTVAYGGNCLINVGPTADGRIPTIFQDRLTRLGAWLSVNGAAIYATQKWRVHNETAACGPGCDVYYTAAKVPTPSALVPAVYAITLGWPTDNRVRLGGATPMANTTVQMLGCSKTMTWHPLANKTGMEIVIPPLAPPELPTVEGPWVFKLSYVL